MTSRNSTTSSPHSDEDLRLTAAPAVVRPGQPITLTVSYTGTRDQQVTLQAHPLQAGLTVGLAPPGGPVSAVMPLQATATIRREPGFVRGGTVRVRFVANAVSGLFGTAEVQVRVRPRYELAALALLLFMGCGAAVFVVAQFVAPPPTAVTPQTAASNTAPPSSTSPPSLTVPPSLTPAPTLTTAPTETPTPTFTPSATPVACPVGTTITHIVSQGETLFGIGQRYATSIGAIMRVNGIGNPNQIFAGQRLRIPCGAQEPLPVTATPTPTDTPTDTPSPTNTPTDTPRPFDCSGFAGEGTDFTESGFYFGWNPPRSGNESTIYQLVIRQFYDDDDNDNNYNPTWHTAVQTSSPGAENLIVSGLDYRDMEWYVVAIQNGVQVCVAETQYSNYELE